MNINELNKVLSEEDIYLGSCGYTSVESIYDITPHEYLEFMEEDLKKSDKRSIINALSNGKRALDCQLEMLLYCFCLQSYTNKEKLNVPKKIMLLNNIGIIAPRILNKINKNRNMMEHEFYLPKFSEVQDFADVILLFICYTDKYLFNTKFRCEIEGFSDDTWHAVKFDREKQKIIVEIRGGKDETVELYATEKTKEDFVTFLKKYIEITSEF